VNIGFTLTVHVSVLDADLREHGELACCQVESPVRAENIVHRGQVRVLDHDLYAECGAVLAGESIPRHLSITTAAVKRQRYGATFGGRSDSCLIWRCATAGQD
jgi:hypothetical protein